MNNQHSIEPRFLTVDEVADLLGIGRNTAYNLVKHNKLPHVHLGRIIRIPYDVLLQHLNGQALA